MGVFERSDSPWYWLWLETAPPSQQKEKTALKIGVTAAQRKDSRRLAEQVYHQRMNELAVKKHKLPRELPPITFDAYATWYDTHVIAHHRGASREREIVKGLRVVFGPTLLTVLTNTAVVEWRSERATATSASNANRETDLLKAMLTSAVPTYLEATPLTTIRRLREKRTETYVLSPANERKLLRALAPADRRIVICALDTLMRLSDVVNLRRDQDRRTYLVVEDPKTKPYKVPVSSRLRAALDSVRGKDPYYFAHRRVAKNARDYRSSLRQMLERACRKAHIPFGRAEHGLTFHALRHTGTTRLVERGVSLRVIQEIGGWSSLRQLERYAHPGERAKRAAVELIGPSLKAHSRKRGTSGRSGRRKC